VEASESADFNLVPGLQGMDDAVKYGANDGVGFLVGHFNGLVNRFGQIGSGHLAHPRCITKKSNTAFIWCPGRQFVAPSKFKPLRSSGLTSIASQDWICELQETLSAGTIALEISRRNARVRALQDRWHQLRAGVDLILQQRDADMAHLPGGANRAALSLTTKVSTPTVW
jgi:hypothetical protein